MILKTSFDFDAAHRLVGYMGKCSNIHGHIWHVDIEIVGGELDNVGIMWDFTNVKYLKDKFDHKTILKVCKDNERIYEALIGSCGDDSVYLMRANPTAENLVTEILSLLKETNPNLKYKIKVWESPKSYAENES